MFGFTAVHSLWFVIRPIPIHLGSVKGNFNGITQKKTSRTYRLHHNNDDIYS